MRSEELQKRRYEATMFSALFDAMPHVTWLYSEDLARVVYVNLAFEQVFARPRAALEREPLAWIGQVHAEDRPRVAAAMEARARGDAPAPLDDFRVVRPDGGIRWLRSWIRRIESTTPGGPVGRFWVETALDVTSERAAAARAEEKGELAANVISMLGAIVVVTDLQFRVVSWNDRFTALCGREEGDLRGRHLAEIVCPDAADPARLEAAVTALARGQHHACGVRRHADPAGGARDIEWRAAPLHAENGRVSGYVGVGRDVTEEIEQRRARRSSDERLRRMSEAMRDVFFLVAADLSRVDYVNPAFERVFGVSREAVYENPMLPFELMPPEDRRIAERAIAPQQSGLRDESEYEVRIVRPDGEVRWISMRARTVEHDETGVKRVAGVIADITERKHDELALQERRAELERLLREKDVLLAEVHHRVKNNLQSISGLMHMMASRAHGRPIEETVEEIEQRIQTMALVHETLYRSSDLAAVDMQTYLGRIVLGVSGRRLRPIEIDVRAEAVTLDLDTALRCGLIVNELVQNALKHAFTSRKHGRIDVIMNRAGDRLVLRVSDDGKGMPADLDFESEATLGLRLVRGLAEQLDGSARRVPDARSAIEIGFPVSR